MRIVLTNGDVLPVTRVNRYIDGVTDKEQLMITFSKNVTLEMVSEKITNDTCQEILLRRDGLEDIKYSGYVIQNLSENITNENESVMATLTK